MAIKSFFSKISSTIQGKLGETITLGRFKVTVQRKLGEGSSLLFSSFK
jgi:hypothetical protein